MGVAASSSPDRPASRAFHPVGVGKTIFSFFFPFFFPLPLLSMRHAPFFFPHSRVWGLGASTPPHGKSSRHPRRAPIVRFREHHSSSARRWGPTHALTARRLSRCRRVIPDSLSHPSPSPRHPAPFPSFFFFQAPHFDLPSRGRFTSRPRSLPNPREPW